MKINKYLNLILSFIILFFIYGCADRIKKSAGVARKSIDEFQAIENPPLVIPPEFNLVDPDQLQEKNIENIEQELAEEILFGLDNKTEELEQLSTMNQILSNAEALNISNDIRDEIDRDFSAIKDTDKIFDMKWENELEVLDAIKESERIRNKTFSDEPLSEGEIPINKEKVKIKKKKRFLIF